MFCKSSFVPEIDDIKIARWSKKRDEKILEDIIKPKDDLINKLYQDNLLMRQQLLRQEKMVEKAEKYEKERNKIMGDNGFSRFGELYSTLSTHHCKK